MLLSIHLCLDFFFFFFNDTATTEIYTLSLHDALPILYGNLRCFGMFHRISHEAGHLVGYPGVIAVYGTEQQVVAYIVGNKIGRAHV